MNSPLRNAFIFLRMIEISTLVLKWPSRAAINRQKAKKGDCSIESAEEIGEKERKIQNCSLQKWEVLQLHQTV